MIIRRSLATFSYHITGVVAAWIYILLFTDKTPVYVMSGILASILILALGYAFWLKEVEFTKEAIHLRKGFSKETIETKDIVKVAYEKGVYKIITGNHSVRRIKLTHLSKEDREKLYHYFRKLSKQNEK